MVVVRTCVLALNKPLHVYCDADLWLALNEAFAFAVV